MRGGAFGWASGKRLALVGGVVLLTGVATWLVVGRRPSEPASGLAAVVPMPQAAVLRALQAPLSATALREDAALSQAVARVAQLLQHGSLRGTQLDGDWGKWVDGRLQPSRSLRLRFDYLLAGLGEVDMAELRLWIGQQVRADLGGAGATQVLAVWDRYLVALQFTSEIKRDPADPAAWQRASSQLGMQRRSALGPDWAYAFYADEKRADEAFLARHQRALSKRTPGNAEAEAENADPAALLEPAGAGLTEAQFSARDAQRVAAFGHEAAERLRAEDAAQAAWAQQLSVVRARLAVIAADPQLSTLQRQQAREAEITRQYSGSALIRARALLAEAP